MSFEILFPFGLWVFEPDWCVGRYGGTTAYLWVGDSPAEVSAGTDQRNM